MSKKIISLLAVVVLTLALTTTAMAARITPSTSTQTYGYGGCSYAGICYDLMRDADGNIVSKDVLEANLDAAIADGTILEADRAYFIDMYDYCSVNGGIGMSGGRGAGRGMGRGCGGMNWAVPNN